MRSALILCGPTQLNVLDFDLVITLRRHQSRLALKLGHPNVVRLFDIAVDRKLAEDANDAETALRTLAKSNPDYRWAILARHRVATGLSYYRQYVSRLELALDSTPGIERVVLSSSADDFLCVAARAVCFKRQLMFEQQTESFDALGTIEPFQSANDLESFSLVNPTFLTKLLRAVQGPDRFSLFYQNYWNLPKSTRAQAVKTGSFFLIDKIRQRILAFFRANPASIYKDQLIQIKFNPNEVALHPRLNFGESTVLLALVDAFRLRTPNTVADRVLEQIKIYFRSVHGKRLIVLDSYNPFSRLLTIAFKELGGQVEHLPHGFTYEEYTNETGGPLSVDRILAWNASSASRYASLGIDARNVTHPLFSAKPIALVPKPWLRILVLLSSGDQFRPTQFEDDLEDLAEVLGERSDLAVDWKFHGTHPEGIALRTQILKFIESSKGQTLNVLSADAKLLDIVRAYDLVVVCGVSTAIAEAAFAGCPVIIFRPFPAGVLHGFQIPVAESGPELRTLLNDPRSYPYDELRRLVESLRSGPPLRI